MTVTVNKSWRVTCHATVEVPLGAGVAWGQLRDFRRFAAQDFFHESVRVAPGGVRSGAALEIDHRFGPFRVTRVGRVLAWHEGRGYSFSDLSRAGVRSGFPHVYRYRLSPAGEGRCVVDVTIAGLWTLRVLPRWAVRLWLAWVFSHIVCTVRNSLSDFAVFAANTGFVRIAARE